MGKTCIPQNDLDCVVNTKWKNAQHISNEQPIKNNFSIVQNKIDEELYNFIMELENESNLDHVGTQLVKFKQSFYANHHGSHPSIDFLLKLIVEIDSIENLSHIIKLMCAIRIDTFFTMGINIHHIEPKVYTLGIGELPLTLESKENYLDDEYSEEIDTFREMLVKVHKFIQHKWNFTFSSCSSFVNDIIVIETLFSEIILNMEESQDPLVTSNSMGFNQFLSTCDYKGFWKEVLTAITTNLDGANTANLFIAYPNVHYFPFFKKFLKVVNTDKSRLSMVKNYLCWCVIKHYGYYTPMVEYLQDIAPKSISEDKIFIDTVTEMFGNYLEDFYEANHKDDNKNIEIKQMFDSMKNLCTDTLKKGSMFESSTTKSALKKLESLDIVVGRQTVDLINTKDSIFPILGNNLIDNVMMIDVHYFKNQMKIIGESVNKYCLNLNNDVNSFTVNAYYDPLLNIIYIPTAITDDLFHSSSSDISLKYGSLGSILAHELMHCFDNSGAKYDYNGLLNDWWTPRDLKKFNADVKKVEDHYGEYYVDGRQLDSVTTVGENMADLTGIKIAFRTYLRVKNQNPIRSEDKIDESIRDKLFFFAWAKIFRSVTTEEYANYLLKTDVHSPFFVRINAPFSHLDEYYEIFGVKEEHDNYLAPEKRCRFLDLRLKN